MGPSALLLCLLAQDAPTHTGTLELEYQLTLSRIELEDRRGEVFNMVAIDLVARGQRAITWSDTWLEVDGGSPVVIERTFERLEGSYTLSLGDEVEDEFVLPLYSPLVDLSLRGERHGQGWSFEVTGEDDPPDVVWLAGLTVTTGIRGLLSDEHVTGPWRLEAQAARDWLQPFGNGAFLPQLREEDPDIDELLFDWSLDQVLHVDLSEVRVDGDLSRVPGKAEFELELTESIDLEPSALALAKRLEDDSVGTWLEAAVLEVTWKGRGTLEGIAAPDTPLVARLVIDVGVTLELDVGTRGLFRICFEGTLEQSQTWR